MNRVLWVGLAALIAVVPAAAQEESVEHESRGQAPRHPLDALTVQEHWAVFEALKSSGRVDTLSRYASVSLREPPKEEVLSWKPGNPFRREALVVVKQGPRTIEAVVDLPKRSVTAWTELEGVAPLLLHEDWAEMEERVKKDPSWRAAMRRRGILDHETIECGGAAPNQFPATGEENRRLLRIRCFDRRGVGDSIGRPIEGVVVLWDVSAEKVDRVIDTGVVPMPRGPVDYDEESVGVLREVPPPLEVEQPRGPAFTVDGHRVTWQNWSFHFRVDPRMGVVVSTVRFDDGENERSVLYQGALSEIFVPYMDPVEGWYHWVFFDLGELTNTSLATSLERGHDCPDNAAYFDAVYADPHGIPERMPRAACLFERYAGDFSWRHRSGPDAIESRRRRDLVLRMIATVGNYDYVVDWVFLQDGTLKVAAATTGLAYVKAVASRTAKEDGGEADRYGRFVAENTVGVNHDHFLSFRLDLDVDGTANSFIVDELQTRELPADHPRRSLWQVEERIARTEAEGKLHMSMQRPALWRVVNPSVIGPFGYPVSYQIKPGHNATSLLMPEDRLQRRGGFTDHTLWVTPYGDKERYAAGDYPGEGKGGDGLPNWTEANRPLENTDLVVWYTLGFHHVPRAEDWPVMAASWHEFELKPFDFFSRNPALDLPED